MRLTLKGSWEYAGMYGVERFGFGLFGYGYMWDLGIRGPHSANKDLQPRPYKGYRPSKKRHIWGVL